MTNILPHTCIRLILNHQSFGWPASGFVFWSACNRASSRTASHNCCICSVSRSTSSWQSDLPVAVAIPEEARANRKIAE
jgi:hypothetical protein